MTTTLGGDGAAVHFDEALALNNTWGRRDLVNGTDFVQTLEAGATLADGMIFAWDWPEVDPRRVLAFPELIAGASPFRHDTAGTRLPIPLDAAGGASVTLAAEWGGPGAFNLAYDLWLTTDPFAGPGAIAHEVMIWLKPGEAPPAGALSGRVEIGGVGWQVWLKDAPDDGRWSYSALVAEAPPPATLDLGALLAAIDAARGFEAGLWLSTVEIGAEVTGGAGWWRATAFDVTTAPVAGGDPAETLEGGAAGDHLAGRGGADRLSGHAGPDRLEGGWGDDTLRGGDGVDLAEGGSGDDSLYGGGGRDRLDGGAGADGLHGGTDADALRGGPGDDSLFGDPGGDRLMGGEGNDWLDGGAGDDRLDGGGGTDAMRGGAGADVFVIRPGGTVRLPDAAPGEDALDLTHLDLSPGDAVWRAEGRGARLDVADAAVILPRLSPEDAAAFDLLF